MNVIGTLVMFVASMCLFYHAATYDSRPPRRWGFTQRARVCSRFSDVMQGVLFVMFSVVLLFESMLPKVRVGLLVLGFFGVFVAMIYDHLRKDTVDHSAQREGSSGRAPLSAGVTRMLAAFILATSIIGTGVGYVLGSVVWFGAVSTGFIVLQVYIFAMAVPWLATIVILNANAGKDVPSDSRSSPGLILRNAPLWSKVLCCVALAFSAFALVSVPFSGGSLEVENWADAPSWTKAAFFFISASMWLLPAPLALAIRRHAKAETARVEQGPQTGD